MDVIRVGVDWGKTRNGKMVTNLHSPSGAGRRKITHKQISGVFPSSNGERGVPDKKRKHTPQGEGHIGQPKLFFWKRRISPVWGNIVNLLG